MRIGIWLPVVGAALLALGGCASSGGAEGPASQPTQQNARSGAHEVGRASGGSACRLLRDNNPGKGRNMIYRCDGRAVLASSEAREALDPSTPVSFGGGGNVIARGLISRQAANATGRSDEIACERALVKSTRSFGPRCLEM